MSVSQNLKLINSQLLDTSAQLIAVTKTYPPAVIQEAYQAGCRRFGENRVQELVPKYEALPKDIEWHLIGHLQGNKVKYIAPFVSMIHSVDSLKLLQEIDRQAAKNHRVINCLLQMYIAQEETKFGLDATEAEAILTSPELLSLNNICIKGLMGMATFTDDQTQIRKEFSDLKQLFERFKQKYTSQNIDFQELSIGMSGDYLIAIEEGSTLVRVGSAIFGRR